MFSCIESTKIKITLPLPPPKKKNCSVFMQHTIHIYVIQTDILNLAVECLYLFAITGNVHSSER